MARPHNPYKASRHRPRKLRAGEFRPRCSAYGVFPDGRKCSGCPDCGHAENWNTPKRR